MADSDENVTSTDHTFGRLPDHLLIEIFIRVPLSDWARISCVKKLWANLFRGELLWQAALLKAYPFSGSCRRWPGPIPRGLSKRRFVPLYQFQYLATLRILLILADQFIACGKPREKAHELASDIWLAVIDNLDENENTFLLLKRLALEGNAFLPYPYARSQKVQWRVFEKLLTDFRDCLNRADYYDLLASAKSRFQPIPSTWLGY